MELQRWDLAELLAVLRRRRAWIAATVAVTVGVAALLSFMTTPTYVARAEVVVEPDRLPTELDAIGRAVFVDQELWTQLRVISSEVVAERVAARLGLDEPAAEVANRLEAAVLPSTRVLQATVRDTDPERARELTQAFVEEYLTFRQEETLNRLTELSTVAEQRLETIRERLAELDARIRESNDPSIDIALVDEREIVANEAAQLEAQVAHLRNTNVQAGGSGRIIRTAQTPTEPVSPRPARNLGVALVVGLGLGVVLALAVDRTDPVIRSDDAAASIAGLPVLGRIPLPHASEGRGDQWMLLAPTSATAESFRTLRTNLRVVADSRAVQTLVVTSAVADEGRTFVATNLALAAAQSGARVALVDADLRDPDIDRIFQFEASGGLWTVTRGDDALEDVLAEVENLPLTLLPAGPAPAGPGAVFASPDSGQVIAELTAQFDLVVIDAPPVLGSADALELTRVAGAAILVVEPGRVSRRELQEAVMLLRRTEVTLPGLVVNRTKPVGDAQRSSARPGRLSPRGWRAAFRPQ